MAKDDKLPRKLDAFLQRTRQVIPSFQPNQLRGRQQSVRVNTLKSTSVLPNPITWAPNCYWLEGDKSQLSHSAEAEGGQIYLQNAASFIPPIVLDPQPGERILDMCAAPGGKASHIAALTNNQAELWVNDNSRPRLARMTANFARLGVKPHSTTMYAIESLRRGLPHEYFDKITLDAPCSGEGMIDLDSPKALEHWSVAHIKRLQSIQKKAILTAWDLLRPGGTLVYSTCTMAPEEDEAVVDYLLRKQDAQLLPIKIDLPNRVPALKGWNGKMYAHDLSDCLRLGPSPAIEPFFVALLHKPVHETASSHAYSAYDQN